MTFVWVSTLLRRPLKIYKNPWADKITKQQASNIIKLDDND